MKLHKSVRLFADKHLENIGTVFQTLYKDEILTDCTLYCKDGSIKAHKVILAASSRYFRNVFVDHKDDNAIFMYGISFIQLKNLVELIYKGSIDVSCDNFNSIFDLAEDLQVSGVLVEDGSNTNHNGFGRDTRYKGQKRVAVDFLPEEQPSPATKCFKEMDRRSSSSSDKSIVYKKEYENDTDNEIHTIDDTPSETIDIDSISDGDRFIGHNIDEAGNLSSWARKERKFKCDLCPSSFKRASHLSRHQLVHTGERPFACGQCDKAFSRHDKLKHHIHKAHELGALNDALGPDSLYTIDHVDILTPETSMIEPHASIMTQHQVHQQVQQVPATLLVPKVEPSYSGSNFTDIYVPQKKGRGRPRKYPPVPVPLVKRPRGRPRINPVVAPPLVKRPRGRPRRINPISVAKREEVDTYSYTAKREEVDTYSYTAKREEVDTYNFTNCPYNENMDYMTKPEDRNEEILPNQEMMEPLVEIKTEPVDKPPSIPDATDTNSFFENIGLFENTSAIAKIGECTISVATTSGAK